MSGEHPDGNGRTVVPDLMLERYRLGELPAADADRIDVRLEHDQRLRRRLDGIERSDREFERDDLSGQMIRRVAERTHQQGSERPAPMFSIPRWAIAAAAVIVVVLLVRPDAWLTGGDTDCCVDRPKGPAATLTIYRNTGSGSETLADNDIAHPGDVVRIGYRTADRGFGAIVSIDGRGVVTSHLPAGTDQAAPLEPGRLVLLDGAFELDDAPQLERFYLITSASPFAVAAVTDAVRRASPEIARGVSQPLTLPETFFHTIFSLRKETRP